MNELLLTLKVTKAKTNHEIPESTNLNLWCLRQKKGKNLALCQKQGKLRIDDDHLMVSQTASTLATNPGRNFSNWLSAGSPSLHNFFFSIRIGAKKALKKIREGIKKTFFFYFVLTPQLWVWVGVKSPKLFSENKTMSCLYGIF